MDTRRQAGAWIERIGFIGVIVLDIFICLNWAASINGGTWLVSIDTGDALVMLLANFVMLFFAGHRWHDHAPISTSEPPQPNTR